MKRRDFMKLSAASVATIAIGSHLPFLGVENAFAATQVLDVTITDAVKNMVTHNSINNAQCYFWVYKMRADGVDIPVECPGPSIYAIKGDTITINITNTLDVPHSFFIPGMFDSGPIAAGATFTGTINASISGSHLYYDNLNEPVNRVMGLHGALVVRPAVAATGHNMTPYDNPPFHIQNMFDDLGNPAVWPGLRWEDGDPATNTPAHRQYVWIYHQPSPNLFDKVGQFTITNKTNYPAAQFVQEITRDPFSPIRANNRPQYFTVNGQSGFFSHFSPAITPMSRVGEPVVIHILNAGVQTVSHHMHCNHFFITVSNKVTDPLVPNPNPIWVDVYTVKPMERVDYVFPFMRPPDFANARGIGRPDQPLQTISGHPVWPPIEEMQTFIPALGTTALNAAGATVELGQRLSPLCYPAHDHLETSQTSQGGNYNMGLITGAYVVGDRNAQSQGLGNFMNFPMDADFAQMFRNIRGIAVNGVNGTREASGPRTVAG